MGQGVNLTGYLDSSPMVFQYLLAHSKALKPIIKEIQGKMSKLAILLPQFEPCWGSGGNLTCFLDSPHMVSYYLPIHFMALNVILKKIIRGFT